MSRKRNSKKDTGEGFLFENLDFEAKPAPVTFEVDRNLLTSKMQAAMKVLDTLDDNHVRLIAMESATVYQSGINLQNVYQLQSLPGRRLDWYEFVAFFYCSFGAVFPAMMDKIDPQYMDCYHKAVNA